MEYISPTKLARKVLGVDDWKHKNSASNHLNLPCSLCGCVHKSGVVYSGVRNFTKDQVVFQKSFNDFDSVSLTDCFVCDECAFFFPKPILSIAATFVLTTEKLYKFGPAKKYDLPNIETLPSEKWAEFFLDPPKPPFVICSNDGKKLGHAIWKSRTSYSRDRFYFRNQVNNLIVDRKELKNCLETAIDLICDIDPTISLAGLLQSYRFLNRKIKNSPEFFQRVVDFQMQCGPDIISTLTSGFSSSWGKYVQRRVKERIKARKNND